MAYNNYFPVGYPFYQMPQQTQPQAQSAPQNGIQWVQGIEGAKAFPVGAGQSALLMDSEESIFFIKTADQAGMPTLRVFDYSERTQTTPAPKVEYVTREEFEKAIAELTPKKKEKKDA